MIDLRRTGLRVLAPALLMGCVVEVGHAGEITDEESDAVRELFALTVNAEECTPKGDHECGAACEESYRASEQLGKMLAKQPAAWSVAEPLFLAEFEASEEKRDKIITFLSSCGSDGCVAVGEKLYAEEPAAFTELQVLAFAEKSSEPFAKEITKRVKRSKCESVLPAAWLAYVGEDAGRSVLEKAVKADLTDENVADALIAAAALRELGDTKAVPYTRKRVHAAVLVALDAGQLERARSMALQTEALQKVLNAEPVEPVERGAYANTGKQKSISLSSIDSQLGWHVRQRSGELSTSDDVFAVIEKITPLS